MVEEQVRHWELKPRRLQGGSPEVWPVVTISREFGTRGVAFGRRVAERLGFRCWDREIVTEIVRRLHTNPETVSTLDGHAHDAIDDLLGVILGQAVIAADYGDQLRQIVGSIAQRGSAVIVGRGAQFLVDPQHALRVRLVAPFEHRVREVETRATLPFDEAARKVRAGDRDRVAFLRQHFGEDGSNPVHYDLLVNTGIYTPERADALVLMAYLAKFGQLPPSTQGDSEESSSGPVSWVPGEPAGTDT
jgi:cytidylate kinase